MTPTSKGAAEMRRAACDAHREMEGRLRDMQLTRAKTTLGILLQWRRFREERIRGRAAGGGSRWGQRAYWSR